MIVRPREEFADTQLVYLDKVRLCLEWLVEFRFSTFDILSVRLGMQPTSTTRFFAKARQDGYIQTFRNPYVRNRKLVFMGREGIRYLDRWPADHNGLDGFAQAKRYKYAPHDLAVQRGVLHRLPRCTAVRWDWNIAWVPGAKRPDALLTWDDEFVLALECELSRKERARVFWELESHRRAIAEGRYAAVIYQFADDRDQEHYRDLWMQEQWPVYRKRAKKDRLEETGTFVRPRELSPWVDKRFVFEPLPMPKAADPSRCIAPKAAGGSSDEEATTTADPSTPIARDDVRIHETVVVDDSTADPWPEDEHPADEAHSGSQHPPVSTEPLAVASDGSSMAEVGCSRAMESSSDALVRSADDVRENDGDPVVEAERSSQERPWLFSLSRFWRTDKASSR